MAKAPTSYIATVGTARTRTIDTLSFPYSARPQAMTMYVRFMDFMGAPTRATYIAFIGAGSGGTLTLYVASGGATYGCTLASATNNKSGTVTRSVSVGDSVELCVTVTAAGVVQVSVAVNGGTVTTGTASSGMTPPQTWAANALYLYETNAYGPLGMRNIQIVRGVHSLAAMRVRMGLTP